MYGLWEVRHNGAKFSMLPTGNHFVENVFIIVQISFSSDIIM